jgi:hypothetical protein
VNTSPNGFEKLANHSIWESDYVLTFQFGFVTPYSFAWGSVKKKVVPSPILESIQILP